MSNENTPTFTYELELKTNPYQQKKVGIRFECLRQIYNASLSFLFKQNKKMRNDITYQKALLLYKNKDTKKEAQKIFNKLQKEYCLDKNGIHAFSKNLKNACYFNDHLDSVTTQNISFRALAAFQEWRFGKRGKPRFKTWKNALKSISSNQNVCIVFKDGKVKWNGLTFDVYYDQKDKYGIEAHALNSPLKFNRIVRKVIRGKTRLFIQLILEGRALQPKHQKVSKGKRVGVDVGVSTVAVVSKKSAFLKPFVAELTCIEVEKKRLNKLMARSLRASNEHNYEPNFRDKWGKNKKGKVIKGSKFWIKSKAYLKHEQQLKELNRKQADKRQMLHNILANDILALGNKIYLEDNNYKAWQKGLFGKTIGFRSPSAFVETLNRKVEKTGGSLVKINTFKSKLSQYCHVCNDYHKKKLSERDHTCGGEIIAQRDLYSASLMLFWDEKKQKVDRNSLAKIWDKGFETILLSALSILQNSQVEGNIPTCLQSKHCEKRESQLKFSAAA